MMSREERFLSLLKEGMTFKEFRVATDVINSSDYPLECLDIDWPLLRKAILKLLPKADYMKIKRGLELCNGHPYDRSFLDIEWEELEEIFKRFKVVK